MSNEQRIQQWVAHANGFATQGKWDEALDAFNKILKHDPHHLEVRNAIIRISIQKADYEEVIHQHMDCAEIYMMRGQRDESIKRYNQILRLEETVQQAPQGRGDAVTQVRSLVAQVKPEIYYQIGDFHLESNKIDVALQYLKKSQELAPGRWEIHMALGRVYMARENLRESIGEFQEVLRLAPEESAQAYEMLGEIFVRQDRDQTRITPWFRNAADAYLKKNNLKDACRVYERMLQIDPNNKEVLNLLGEYYGRLGQKDRASQVLEKLASIFEEEGNALDKVIQIYEQILQQDPARYTVADKLITIYQDILQRSPGQLSIRVRLVDHLQKAGRTEGLEDHYFAIANHNLERGVEEEAVKYLRKLLELDPNHLEAREILADYCLKNELRSESLEEFQHVIRILRSRNDQQRALEVQQRLLRLFPEAAEMQYEVAIALKERGDYAGAAQELDRLLSQRPDDLVALQHKAECLLGMQSVEGAAHCYVAILRLDATNVDVRRQLIGTLLQMNQLDAASQHLKLLGPNDPKRLPLLKKLISKFIEAKLSNQAEAELRELPSDDESCVLFRKELVKLYLDQGNLEKAFEGLPEIPRSDRERNSLVTRLLEIPLGQGDYETAAQTIHRLPEDDPLRLSFHRRLISTYAEVGRFEDASRECKALPAHDEVRPKLASLIITGLLASGQLDRAAEEIRLLDDQDGQRNSFMGQLIENYLTAGNLERAAEVVHQLNESDGIKPRYHRRMIQAYLNANLLEQAERDVVALDESDPERRSFLRLLVQKYLALGQFDRLRELCNHMPEDMEERTQLMDGLVHNYLDSGELGKARHQIFAMAEAAAGQSNHGEAERLYRDILAYQPSDTDIRLRLSHTLSSLGEPGRAREGLLLLAGRFHKEGNATSAADIYSRILELDSSNLNARYRLGMLWAEQGQVSQALEQFSQLAKVYLEQNLPEVAQRVLKKILELDPKDIEHRRQVIKLLIRNLRFEEATEHYRVLMGIHLERGQVEEALEYVKEIVNLQPLNLDLRQSLGTMFLKSGFLEHGQTLLEALASECKSKKDHERHYGILQTLVDCYSENEQWEMALEYRERIADLERETESWSKAEDSYLKVLHDYLVRAQKESADGIFVKLVDGFFRNRSVVEGIERLEQSQAALVEEGQPIMALAIRERIAHIYERLDNWDRAIQVLEEVSEQYLLLGQQDLALEFLRRAADQALAHDRTDHGIESLFKLAGKLVEFKGLQAARPVLDELLRLAQENVNYLERIGTILFRQGLYSEARPIYHEVLEKQPGRPEALSRVAIIYAREGRLEDAADIARQIFSKGLLLQIIEEYKQTINFSEGDAGSHIRLGRFFQQLGFREEAILEFCKVTKEPLRILQARNYLANCFLQQGYLDLAVRQFQEALELPGYQDEEQLEVRFNLACALEQAGKPREAMQAFQECYAVDIRYRDVAKRMEELGERMGGA
jgi:tetratricopeptide (TPR) repeat protein